MNVCIGVQEDFNVEQFVVECRRRVAMDVLRNDLHVYLKILQSAMIELINKDYADFVNLSTNLVWCGSFSCCKTWCCLGFSCCKTWCCLGASLAVKPGAVWELFLL